jgi:hypothetical protein
MKRFFALLTIILFMAGTIVLGPVYLLLYLSQQIMYTLETVTKRSHRRMAH